MSDIGDLIAVGLLGERNGLGLTANEAHAVGERVASHLPGLVERERDDWRDIVERWKGIAEERGSFDAAWAEAEAALPEGWALRIMVCSHDGVVGPWKISAGPDLSAYVDPQVYAEGAPAAALRALAAKLRGLPR